MIVTVSFLGVTLCFLLAVFILNKRRLIAFYYPNDFPLNNHKEGSLRLLTYNVAGLPEKISSAKAPRYESMLQIGAAINEYDIVNVQEDFNYNIQLYSKNTHTYKTAHRGKAIWGDGLNTFSKFPILEFKRVAWKKCNGSDCLTPKGFSLARMSIAKGVIIDVYNVHATAANSLSAAKARGRNLLQLAEYILEYSADRPLLVMGDFNAHYQYNLDNMLELLKLTQLQDIWVETQLNGKYPDVQDNFEFISDLDCTDELESIDKILYRNSAHLVFKPLQFKMEQDNFKNNKGMHLSDHLAVMAEIAWKNV